MMVAAAPADQEVPVGAQVRALRAELSMVHPECLHLFDFAGWQAEFEANYPA
jgi:hypothetical protein